MRLCFKDHCQICGGNDKKANFKRQESHAVGHVKLSGDISGLSFEMDLCLFVV